MNRPIIIIGAGGHAQVLIYSLNALRREIIGILHPDASMIGQSIAGIPILGSDDKVKDYGSDVICLVNGVGSVSSMERRKDIYMKFKKKGYLFAKVIHPSAIVMDSVKLGEGSQIMAGAIIQSGCVIGDDSIINTGAIVDHDCIIGAHTHVAPGVVLSGGVHIGDMVHVGTSATVIQGVEIGDTAIIGAGAVVVRNILPGRKVVGVPAQEINK